MIPALVTLFVVCLCVGLGLACHALRDEIAGQDARLARVESLLKKVVALLAVQEMDRERDAQRREAA